MMQHRAIALGLRAHPHEQLVSADPFREAGMIMRLGNPACPAVTVIEHNDVATEPYAAMHLNEGRRPITTTSFDGSTAGASVPA